MSAGPGPDLRLWASVASIAAAMGLASRGVRQTTVQRITRSVGGRAGEAEGGPAAPRWHALLGVGALRTPVGSVCLGGLGGALGWALAGPMGSVMGTAVGIGAPIVRDRRHRRRRAEALEGQLAEVSEGVSLALRSGLSVTQALDFCRAETLPPARDHLDRFVDEQRVGVPFEAALEHLGDAFGSDDARLFVLVTGIHARSGGDLSGALDEVATTIRHRVGVRRELRAASAQGRISGAIMGALPIGFFLFLSITSHGRLSPVLRSAPGMVMVGTGLAMEGLAYLWIRRLLEIEP